MAHQKSRIEVTQIPYLVACEKYGRTEYQNQAKRCFKPVHLRRIQGNPAIVQPNLSVRNESRKRICPHHASPRLHIEDYYT
ncbi:MAG TPA: hypothetical protein VFI93_10255, partial [Rhizomicrobium sp.]|nr:hypothetical protein [Rhizomicrobium sp.]